MNLKELKEEINKDVRIDPSDLSVESLKIADITNKYLRLRTDENIILKMIERKYKILYKNKWEYYTGKATEEYKTNPFPFHLLKQDVPIYMESDKELCKILDEMDLRKEKIRYIDSIIQVMNQRSFNISNAIKWQEFVNGGK